MRRPSRDQKANNAPVCLDRAEAFRAHAGFGQPRMLQFITWFGDSRCGAWKLVRSVVVVRLPAIARGVGGDEGQATALRGVSRASRLHERGDKWIGLISQFWSQGLDVGSRFRRDPEVLAQGQRHYGAMHTGSLVHVLEGYCHFLGKGRTAKCVNPSVVSCK